MINTITSAYLVRKASCQDLVDVKRITLESWLATYPQMEPCMTEARIREFLYESKESIEGGVAKYMQDERDVTWNVWVCVDEPHVIGYCSVDPREEPGHFEIQSIYVLPEYQGVGAGSLLLIEVFGALPEGSKVSVQTLTSNTHARRFYEKHNFVYAGDGAPFVFMGHEVPQVRYVRVA